MLLQVYQIAFSNDTSLKGYVHFTLSSEYVGATTFSITTLSKIDLIVTLGITILGICIECHHAECRFFFDLMLSFVMPSVVILSIVTLNVVGPVL
jgi:hypothetical protein